MEQSQNLKSNPALLQQKIKHIVVLMLENRSFDNLLGWLYENRKTPDGQAFEGLTWDLWNPLDNIDGEGLPFIEKVPVEKNGQAKFRGGKSVPNPVDFSLPRPDPGEGYADTTHQLFQRYQVGAQFPPTPINTGFVQNYQNAMLYGAYVFGDAPTDPRRIMTCYTPEQTPVLSALARGFAVCDHYHCPVPSQTLPNRSFAHAATSGGNVNNAPNTFCDARTIFNQIQDAIDAGNSRLSWGIFGNNLMKPGSKPGSSDASGGFDGDHFSLTRLAMTQLHDPRFNTNFHTLDAFYELCRNGELPSYAFLEPQFGGEGQNDQHPDQDIRPGEALIAQVYNAIKSSPAFNDTLLIITYDEHGGCYDHVPPPNGAKPPDASSPPGQNGFLFNRFGVRVPAVLVSPYIRKGLVARPDGHFPFDHTSIIKTVQLCFGLTPYLTERSAAAPDFSCVLSDQPARSSDLPDVQPLAWDTQVDTTKVNELHRVIAGIIEQQTGQTCPSDAQMLAFIQTHYTRLFGGA
jgi:phospholipase C